MFQSTTRFIPIAIGVVTASIAWAAPATAAHDDLHEISGRRCTVLDSDLLDITLQPSGHLKFVYAGDRYVTCNEAMVVNSYASAEAVLDSQNDLVVDQITFHVADLEAAGPAGVTVDPVLDPCWAGLEVLRDGDTLLWEHVDGDGCEMEITTDFLGGGFDTEIHVVQQTGTIVPPHIFHHDHDETTVLTGLPNGTWYVKVYEGYQPATTISVDGGAPVNDDIVNGVPDGSSVSIEHPAVFTGADDIALVTVPPVPVPVMLSVSG